MKVVNTLDSITIREVDFPTGEAVEVDDVLAMKVLGIGGFEEATDKPKKAKKPKKAASNGD